MSRVTWFGGLALAALIGASCGGEPDASAQASGASPDSSARAVIALWEAGMPAFGIFVPSERERGATDAQGNRLPPLYTAEGARRLAEYEELDYLFLNLEGSYDGDAVRAMVEGLQAAEAAAGHRPMLLVRVPTIENAGADATRARVREIVTLGADGVVIPHIRSPEEARLAAGFFEEAGADVWSPSNPDGSHIAMLMVEDQGAIAAVEEIIEVPGYSMLSCGIGSLTGDMEGDRDGAEAACQEVQRLGWEAGLPSMMTADARSIEQRIGQGYLGLLLSGSIEQALEVTRAGHAVAERRTP